MKLNDLAQHLCVAVRKSCNGQPKLPDNGCEKRIPVDVPEDWECRQELELMVHQEHQVWAEHAAIL
jgi:hypothetical protein